MKVAKLAGVAVLAPSGHQQNGQAAAKQLAGQVIDAAYGHGMGAVLFKPTLRVNPQTLRTTREGALSCFVGGNANFPADTGFALQGWTQCAIENAGVFIAGDSAGTMAKERFTGKGGKVTTVDRTWSCVKDDAGGLRIVVHHSSREYPRSQPSRRAGCRHTGRLSRG